VPDRVKQRRHLEQSERLVEQIWQGRAEDQPPGRQRRPRSTRDGDIRLAWLVRDKASESSGSNEVGGKEHG
jgi:hypothetical protein